MTDNETNILIHISSQEFQWYALEWSNQFVRYLVGSWENIKINDIITITENKGTIMKFKVTHKQTSTNIKQLVTQSNYINLYPLSQNYQTTFYYIQNKLRKQKPLFEKYEEFKLGLFTIKLIK